MRKTSIFLPIILVSLALTGYASRTAATEGAKPEYKNISNSTLEEMITERKGTFLLINTYTPFKGNIPHTYLNIPSNEISQRLDLLPEDKDAEIMLYCKGGRISLATAEDLIAAVYTRVKDLVGGFLAWEAGGLRLETASQVCP